MEEQMVSLSITEYEALLETKHRVDMLCDYIKQNKCVSIPNVLTILGRPSMILDIQEELKELESEYEEYLNEITGVVPDN